MRILLDVHGIHGAMAWRVTSSDFSYTITRCLPEALESWRSLVGKHAARHMQIIYRINASISSSETHQGSSTIFSPSVSIIDEKHGRKVRMGASCVRWLASGEWRVGASYRAHAQDRVSRSATLYPERIVNKTNGITFRVGAAGESGARQGYA